MRVQGIFKCIQFCYICGEMFVLLYPFTFFFFSFYSYGQTSNPELLSYSYSEVAVLSKDVYYHGEEMWEAEVSVKFVILPRYM